MACGSCTSFVICLFFLAPHIVLFVVNFIDKNCLTNPKILQVVLSRKEDVLALEREGEDALGMIHAVLSAVPPLSEDDLSIQ